MHTIRTATGCLPGCVCYIYHCAYTLFFVLDVVNLCVPALFAMYHTYRVSVSITMHNDCSSDALRFIDVWICMATTAGPDQCVQYYAYIEIDVTSDMEQPR